MMIHLFEHFEYGESKGILENLSADTISLLEEGKEYCKTVKRRDKNALCFHIHKIEEKVCCKTSYFVGIDWIVKDKLPVYVQPKLNKEDIQINYLAMLFEALQEPENLQHLDGLLDIDFNKSSIEVPQTMDMLSPFLLLQFLQVLRNLVRKGLRKSYYPIINNLEARVKGKVLTDKSLKNNTLKGKLTKTVCQYEEFGINNDENKLLKKAYIFSRKAIQQYAELDIESVKQTINYIYPAFENVSDNIMVEKIKGFKPNPIYKEYEQALKLAILILKRYSFNISQTESKTVLTPPFWIDMSKLFELYVFKQLRGIFPNHKEVQYHFKTNYQELDYLLNSIDDNDKPLKMVIDAKYKYYSDRNIEIDDARQISGYARLKKIYSTLEVDEKQLIDCLVIYSDQKTEDVLSKDGLKQHEDSHYQNFYKIGISLPEIKQ